MAEDNGILLREPKTKCREYTACHRHVADWLGQGGGRTAKSASGMMNIKRSLTSNLRRTIVEVNETARPARVFFSVMVCNEMH